MSIYTSDFEIHGPHRDRVRSLVASYKFFPSYVNLFCVAPVIGFLFGRKASLNKDEEPPAKIQANQMIFHDTRIQQVFRLIVLNDPTLKIDIEARVDSLFRNETVSSEAIQSFEDYFRGGVDILYEKLIDGAMDQQNAILRIGDLMTDIDMQLGSTNREKVLQAYKRL